MKYLILISLSFLSLTCFGQKQDSLSIQNTDTLQVEKNDSNAVYGFGTVAKNAQYVGGQKGMTQYFAREFQYPEKELKLGHSGIVYISFVIEKDGSLSQIKIIKKSPYDALNREALRLIHEMPKWQSAQLTGGKIVRQCIVLPIKFQLQ